MTMRMRFLTSAFLVLNLWPALASAQSAAICAANLAQFPQACPCIIEQSRSQGIDGPVLDALLANQVADLPIGTFQAYGAIFTQCITDVVTGQMPTAPPAPAPAAAPSPGPNPGPMVLGTDGRTPGTWGLSTLTFPGGGVALPGTFDGQGGAVALHCSGGPHAASLVLEGLGTSTTAQVTLRVEGGAGFERTLTAQRYNAPRSDEGPIWQTALPPDLVQAIRTGNTLSITSQAGTARRFGLTGSNRAIGPGTCAIPQADRGFPIANFGRVPEGRWQLDQTALEAGPEPVLRYSVGVPFLPELLVTCDGGLATRQRPGRGFSGAFSGELALFDLDGVVVTDFTLQGNAYRTPPLEPGILSATAAAPEWLVALDIYAEPGDVIVTQYDTEGLAQGLDALSCPAPFAPGPAPAPLTGAWAFGEMPDLPRPDLFAAASFTPEDQRIPPLHFECDGTPFFDQSLLGGLLPRVNGYRLRLTAGTVTFEDSFGGVRLWGRPSGIPADFRATLGTAPNLRVTGLDAAGFDAVYPLDGLAAFFGGPLCQS